jgi:hypothetical protein
MIKEVLNGKSAMHQRKLVLPKKKVLPNGQAWDSKIGPLTVVPEIKYVNNTAKSPREKSPSNSISPRDQ